MTEITYAALAGKGAVREYTYDHRVLLRLIPCTPRLDTCTQEFTQGGSFLLDDILKTGKRPRFDEIRRDFGSLHGESPLDFLHLMVNNLACKTQSPLP